MLLGLRVAAIEEEVNRLGISLEREGYDGEDAVVVHQSPLNTVDILKARSVKTFAVPHDSLLKLSFMTIVLLKT